MVDINLKTYTYNFFDVNDKGYITKLDIIVEAHTEREALDIIYNMDNHDEIDYSKAKTTRKKYKASDECEDEYLQEFLLEHCELKYPAHFESKTKYLSDCIKINIPNFIDSLDKEERQYIKKLIEELDGNT